MKSWALVVFSLLLTACSSEVGAWFSQDETAYQQAQYTKPLAVPKSAQLKKSPLQYPLPKEIPTSHKEPSILPPTH